LSPFLKQNKKKKEKKKKKRMPTVGIGRDKLFAALGKVYSKKALPSSSSSLLDSLYLHFIFYIPYVLHSLFHLFMPLSSSHSFEFSYFFKKILFYAQKRE